MDNEERLLISMIVLTSVLMIVGSFRYAQEMRYAPQAAATATILFAIITVANENSLISLGEKDDLGGKINEKAASLEKGPSEQNKNSVSEVAGPGEFRIDLPIIQYEVPKLGYIFTPRTVLTVLLFAYAAMVWMFGIFISSVVFLILFSKTRGVSKREFIILSVFSVLILLVFGLYLETPLFRPKHDLFEAVLLV